MAVAKLVDKLQSDARHGLATHDGSLCAGGSSVGLPGDRETAILVEIDALHVEAGGENRYVAGVMSVFLKAEGLRIEITLI